MKITTMYLPMAAMLVTAALSMPITADQVPFKGTLQGHETDTPEGGPPPTTLSVEGTVTGTATHVGQFSFTYELTVDLSNGTAVGVGQLIAANGDEIYTSIVGSSHPSSTPGVADIMETDTITGGTGRFAETQGYFTVQRSIDQASGITQGLIRDGNISAPGAAHAQR